ncbi:ML domain-containing protein [Pyronema domesticum]|uniref:Phosphatidylglycerol/phosphatidylinositol transfer protein n=1 Tax=Pyronema omphalodes (strain CBS 100304) TaxID=1076935 RepID=U4LP95_PYROM|nr:ML domain-containing protein [Pyronema domesticum]CCX31150.1 Similar to Phosphatidylglycerol/phosphatidylinositol transfer protein; acc. no. Q4X136 [Pyronema omphalodes CBS 100304]
MKLLPILLATVATANAGSFFQQNGNGLVEFVYPGRNVGPEVPGENPMHFCADPSGDLAVIESVNLLPNPPVPGATLKIDATGLLKETIAEGAMVDITVKYGLITLIRETLDLCENSGQVDLKCPVEAGKLILTKSVDIPKQIPPGQYTVTANAYTADGVPITCLTATVKFNIG